MVTAGAALGTVLANLELAGSTTRAFAAMWAAGGTGATIGLAWTWAKDLLGRP